MDKNRIILPITPEAPITVTQNTFRIFQIPEICYRRDLVTGNEDDRGHPCDEWLDNNELCPHTLDKQGRWRKKRLERYNDYKSAVLAAAKKEGFEIPDSGWSIYFFMPMPKRWSLEDRKKMNGQKHKRKPDIDKLYNAVADSLTFTDEQISQLSGIGKFWVDTTVGKKKTDPVGPGWILILINQEEFNPFNVEWIDQSSVVSLRATVDYKKRREEGETRTYKKVEKTQKDLFKKEDRIK